MKFIASTVKLDEVPAAEEFLSPREMTLYSALRFEKRRRDWLGGRFAAKRAANAFAGAADCEVLNRPSRQPYLAKGGEELPLFLSITHSGDFAAAAVSGFPVGMDLETVAERPQSWRNEFFSAEEARTSGALALTELWARKEAVLKLLGIGLTTDLKKLTFDGSRPRLEGEALAAWRKLNSIAIDTVSRKSPPGYITAVAFDAVNGGTPNGRFD